MTRKEKTRLLFGPYRPPRLKVGDRTECLYRGAEVVVCDWTVAPIPWPICYVVGRRAPGRGILVDEELARAVQHESAVAIMHWWGVSQKTACNWRRKLGVRRTDSEGSHRLIRQAALGGLNARRKHRPRRVRLWTDDELDFLGKVPDVEVARRTGRTVKAAAMMRAALGLPAVPTGT